MGAIETTVFDQLNVTPADTIGELFDDAYSKVDDAMHEISREGTLFKFRPDPFRGDDWEWEWESMGRLMI